MASQEQMERATREIEELSEEYAFRRIDDRRVGLASHGRGTEDGYAYWAELSDAQKRDALAGGVDWGGFTEGEKADVIGRVVDGEPAAAWMDGIKSYNPEEDFSRPLTRRQHAAYLADIAAASGMTAEEMDDYYESLAGDAPRGGEAPAPAGPGPGAIEEEAPSLPSPGAIAAGAIGPAARDDAAGGRTRPDIDDVIHVRAQIAALTGQEYRGFTNRKDGRLLCEWAKASDWTPGDTEGTEIRSWDRDDPFMALGPEGKEDILRKYVDWGRFSEGNIRRIIANVGGGQAMEDVVRAIDAAAGRKGPGGWFEGVSFEEEPGDERHRPDRAPARGGAKDPLLSPGMIAEQMAAAAEAISPRRPGGDLGPGETPLERAGRQIVRIKATPAPWDRDDWSRLPEAEKLHRLARKVDWRDVRAEDKHRLLGREVDLARVSPGEQRDALGQVLHDDGDHEGRRNRRVLAQIEAVGRSPRWPGMDRREKAAALERDVQWDGFAADDRFDVIENVLQGKGRSDWLEGIATLAEKAAREAALWADAARRGNGSPSSEPYIRGEWIGFAQEVIADLKRADDLVRDGDGRVVSERLEEPEGNFTRLGGWDRLDERDRLAAVLASDATEMLGADDARALLRRHVDLRRVPAPEQRRWLGAVSDEPGRADRPPGHDGPTGPPPAPGAAGRARFAKPRGPDRDTGR